MILLAIFIPVGISIAVKNENTNRYVEKEYAYIKFRGQVEYENMYLPVPKDMTVYKASLLFNLKPDADINSYKLYFGSSSVGIANDRIVEDNRTYYISKR